MSHTVNDRIAHGPPARVDRVVVQYVLRLLVASSSLWARVASSKAFRMLWWLSVFRLAFSDSPDSGPLCGQLKSEGRQGGDDSPCVRSAATVADPDDQCRHRPGTEWSWCLAAVAFSCSVEVFARPQLASPTLKQMQTMQHWQQGRLKRLN